MRSETQLYEITKIVKSIIIYRYLNINVQLGIHCYESLLGLEYGQFYM